VSIAEFLSVADMTKRQWIEQRQENSQIPWQNILYSGFDAVPCDCGLQGCQGWTLAKVGKRVEEVVETENEAA
jgi:hypothetical protein